MLNQRRIGLAAAAALFCAVTTAATAQSLEISWYTVDGGGAMFSTGGDFELSGTIGQPDANVTTGGSFALTGGFWSGSQLVGPPIPGDCDHDGDVDLGDYADIEMCLLGPVVRSEIGCECFDFDLDGDNDLVDFAAFQAAFFPD